VTTGLPSIFQRAARLDFLDGFGIAIGQRHVALVHLVKRLASVSLQRHRVVPLPGPEEGEARKTALAAAVGSFVGDLSIDTDRTYVSLPRAQAVLSRMSLPAAAKADLRQVVEFEIDRVIPLARDEIYYDFLVREIGGATGKLDVLVISLPRRVVSENLAALEQAGVRARSVVITPVALLDFLRFARRGEVDGVAMVFDDGGTIEFDYVGKGLLAASHLVRPDEVASSAAISRLVNHETLATGAPEGSVSVYGWQADAALPGFSPASALSPELLASGPDLIRLTQGALIAPEEVFTSPNPTLASAIGVGLAAVREGSSGLNLLPLEERRAVDEGAPLVTFLLAAVLLLVSLVWLTSAMIKDHRVETTLHGDLASLEEARRTVHRNEDEAKALRDKLRVLTQDDRKRVSLFLKELTEAVPKEAYLTTFRLRSGKLELEGFAKSASDLVPLLEKSPFFKNVQFTSPVTKVQNNQERFSLTMEIEE
jgi:general secretion pathway protein L